LPIYSLIFTEGDEKVRNLTLIFDRSRLCRSLVSK